MRRDLNDAYALLGLEPGADAAQIAAAYRARAKEEHPDRSGEQHAADRMAAVNAAHEVLTAALLTGVGAEDGAAGRAPGDPADTPGASDPSGGDGVRPRVRPGAWLTAQVRRALGPELVEELSQDEPVDAVAAAATWASPHTVLALTDRRLLWLLDDAVSGRVRSLRLRQIADVRSGVRGIVRPSGYVTVQPRHGRKATFTELPAAVAEDLARRIRARID